MRTMTATKRPISDPDEVVEFPRGHVDTVRIGDQVFNHTVFEPGWRWSESVKPIAGTESCELPHVCFVQSGALHVRMDDGTEVDAVAGEFLVVPPGHDAWVVGDEPAVVYDFGGDDQDFGKPPA